MKCLLCQSRKGKRFCPAKAGQICPVCCGTKREVEIDCPSDCVYLHAGREYESSKLARTAPPLRRTERLWEPSFLRAHYPLMMRMSQVIAAVRRNSPELADSDVQATFDSLLQTFNTLDKGIYYDFAPERVIQRELYLALKQLLEGPDRIPTRCGTPPDYKSNPRRLAVHEGAIRRNHFAASEEPRVLGSPRGHRARFRAEPARRTQTHHASGILITRS